MSDITVVGVVSRGQECQRKEHLLLDFFFGFVFLDPFVFVAALIEVLDSFGALDPLVDLDLFVAALSPFGADFDLFVLTSCAARLANDSCLLEQPVAAKICLIVGDVSSSSSSMVAREELEALEVSARKAFDNVGACDDDALEEAIECFVRTFFLVTCGFFNVT